MRAGILSFPSTRPNYCSKSFVFLVKIPVFGENKIFSCKICNFSQVLLANRKTIVYYRERLSFPVLNR